MEECSFIDSFRKFIRECDVPFTEQRCSFFFPLHKLEIRLLTGEISSRLSVREGLFSQMPALPATLSEQNLLVFPDILYLYQDRWIAAPQVTRQRIAARLGKFESVFARKCTLLTGKEWLQLQKKDNKGDVLSENDFLNRYHAYGYATSKYRYALLWEGAIVAVATFSPPRPMLRQLANPLCNVSRQREAYESNDATLFRSYEWVRYASLPGMRVIGGMGKLLQAFLRDIAHPDNSRFAAMPIEVMSYSDNEWSSGKVYETLGFSLAGERAPVEYYVDKKTHERFSMRKLKELYYTHCVDFTAGQMPPLSFLENYYRITNQGSRKYLLQTLNQS